MALTRTVSDFKDSVKAATIGANINLAAAPNTLDGVSLVLSDRVLVKDQTPSSLNGIYRVTTLGTGSNGSWTRAADFNDYRQISSGALTFVEQGTTNGNIFYYIPGGEPNVQIGTTAITFANLFSSFTSTATLQTVTNYGNSTTNIITISNTTPATSTTSGALVVSGGMGIGGNLFIGGNLSIAGNTTFINTTVITTSDTIAAPAINAGTIGNSGATFTGATQTLTSTSQAASFTTSGGGQHIGYHTGAIGANSANSGAFTTLTASGNTTLNNYANIYIATGSISQASALTVVGNVYGQGGIGYLDFLKLQNTYSAVTNPNKYFRIDQSGAIQIINSAYTNNIFNLTDAGDLTVPGKLTMSTGVFWSNGAAYSSGGGGGSTSPGGANTYVQFNDGGSFGGATYIQYNKTSGNLVISSTTASTSQTTGAIVVSGGIGVGGNVNADIVHATNNGNGTNFQVGDDLWLGDINVSNTARVMGQQDNTQGYIVFGSTNATNYIGRSGSSPITVTGAFNVTGTLTGVGQIVGYFNGAIGANTANTGAFTTVTTTGNLYSGGNIIAASGTTSTSTTTGALVVGGGVGISGALYMGGNLVILGNSYIGPVPTTFNYNAAPLNLTNSLAGALKTQLNLINTGGGAGAGSAIDFYTYTSVAGGSNPEARISTTDDGNYSGYIGLWTKTPGNVGANSLVERLRVDSAGNVVVFQTTTSTSTTTGALVVGGGVGVSGNLYVGGSLSIAGNTTFVNTTIINTTDTISAPAINAGTIGNAGAALTGLTATVNTVSAGLIGNASATLLQGTLITAAQGNITSVGTLTSLTVTGNTYLATSSGYVAIGTTSAIYRLGVLGGATQLSGSTSSAAGLRLQTASGVATLTGINYDNNAFNPIAFYTGATEAMRIDSSGNVGIGTTSPRTLLTVNGAATITTLNLTNALTLNGSTSGQVTIAAPAVAGTNTITLPAATDTLATATQANAYNGFKNRIINGAMVIDQRNAGASVTPANGAYTLDRWIANLSQASKFSVQRNAGSVTLPAGYINYLGVTSLSAYTVGSGEVFAVSQYIEGLNCADFAWGSASAATVTLSFWVRSSLTGTFGGVITNNAQDRSYPFSYSISAANTWEQKTITIAGDTSGTWLTTNGIGIAIRFSLGSGSTFSGTAGAWAGSQLWSTTGATSVVGTNGATFYITGVQLEKGSTATSFDYRPYGTELALCQRYYAKSYDVNTVPGTATTLNMVGNSQSGAGGQGNFAGQIYFPVILRAVPSVSYWDGAGNASKCSRLATAGGTTWTNNATANGNPFNIGTNGFLWYGDNSVANFSCFIHYTANAEL